MKTLLKLLIVCAVSFATAAFCAERPDVTRYDAQYLDHAVSIHVEWQSPNPVTKVNISAGSQVKDIAVDEYDNKRNPYGYQGEVSVTLPVDPQLFQPGVSTGGTALETHRRGMEGITANEYVIAKQPIDRHFIGAAWSKQYGPVDEPGTADVRIKKERSFSGVQQDFAYNAGITLGAKPVVFPVQGEVGIQGGSIEKALIEGVEIITPASIADIPFEPGYNYVTEALRLNNFRIQDEKSNKAGISAGAGSAVGSATATAEVGSQAKRGTEGQGLVVAYKLQTIDTETIQKKDSGIVPLSLDKSQDFPDAGIIVNVRLQTVEPGSGKSLPRNVIWSCARADAQSKNIIAAWMVDIKPLDSKRKPLTVAFPAFPKINQCQQFNSTIFARIDPLTDRIIRQRLSLVIMDDDLNEQLKPVMFDGRISLANESFKIRTVMPDEIK